METHTEILPDFPNKCIIALRVIDSERYLAAIDLEANHGLDTGLTVRGHCDRWEKFILYKSGSHISLQNLDGGFLSPINDQWTFCGHLLAWERFDILVKEEGSLTKHIAISTRNLDGEYPLSKRYLAPPQEGSEDCILQQEEYYWEIVLAEPPVLNIYPIIGKIDSFTGLKSCNLSVVKKIVRAHKDVGFFHVIGHQVPLDLFSILKNSIGIVPWKDDRKLGDDDRKKNYALAEWWSGEDIELENHDWWPEFLDNQIRLDYFKNCAKLADTLLHALALGQQLISKKSPPWRQMFKDDAYLAVRGLVYHPGPVTEEFLTTEQHTDATWITLLVEDDVGGLEIRKGNHWMRVPYIEGGILVNTGNVLESESGGDGVEPFYKSVCHRVVRVSESKTRFSMPFFYDRKGSKTGGC